MVTRGARLRIALFLALLVLSLVRVELSLLRTGPLAGFEKPLRLALPTPGSWWNGKFQRRFERWFARRLKGREHLVRTDNQVSLSLFGQAPSGGTPLVLSRGGTIIEKAYLDEYNRPRTPPADRLAAFPRELRRLEELLAHRGVGLVVVVAPSKVEIYPEAVPPRWVLPGRARRRSTYELLAPQLEASGITLVDGHRLFLDERARSDSLLFARGGTHWNHYGTALVVERLLAALERQVPGRFVQLSVRGARVDSEIWFSDDDLGELLNVWWPRPWPGPQTHPVVERRGDGRAMPRLLFVGDSFTLSPLEYMSDEGLMRSGECLYYFKRRIRYPGAESAALERDGFDISREIDGMDAVVLLTSEINLMQEFFGFVEAAVSGLEAAEAVPPGEMPPGP